MHWYHTVIVAYCGIAVFFLGVITGQQIAGKLSDAEAARLVLWCLVWPLRLLR